MSGPLPQRNTLRKGINASSLVPPPVVECAYYAALFYGILGSALGLAVGMLGAGMLTVLAVFCIVRIGSRARVVYASILFPLGCGISFLVLQILWHGESVRSSSYVRPFIPWMLTLIVVQSLALRRGFLHRFALVAFCLGLAFLPYLSFQGEDQIVRAGLERSAGLGGLGNPNDLGAWFGFCAVYFLTLGVESRRVVVRVVSLVVALLCLFIVALTVSRGPLFAVAIAGIVEFRRTLKRGFLPVLLLAVSGWTAYGLGPLGDITSFYAARGMDTSGRFLVWPSAIEQFLSSPLTGVGASKIAVNLPGHITPHNSFLFIALASGAVPLMLFVAYWLRTGLAVFRSNVLPLADVPFHTSLLIYCLLIAQMLNQIFMEPWMIVTLSSAALGDPSRILDHVAMSCRSGRSRVARHSKVESEGSYVGAAFQR